MEVRSINLSVKVEKQKKEPDCLFNHRGETDPMGGLGTHREAFLFFSLTSGFSRPRSRPSLESPAGGGAGRLRFVSIPNPLTSFDAYYLVFSGFELKMNSLQNIERRC